MKGVQKGVKKLKKSKQTKNKQSFKDFLYAIISCVWNVMVKKLTFQKNSNHHHIDEVISKIIVFMLIIVILLS